MDSEASSSDPELAKCCDYGCSYCSAGAGKSSRRAVKHEVDAGLEDEECLVVTGVGYPARPIAGVQIENECDALREMVNNQRQSIHEIYAELEEERNSSSTAASEVMSMIMRLLRDKFEIQLEARHFKRYTEVKMAHDQQQISALEALLHEREQVIQSLTCEDMAPARRMPMRKPSIFCIFPFVAVFIWVASIVFWRKDINQSTCT